MKRSNFIICPFFRIKQEKKKKGNYKINCWCEDDWSIYYSKTFKYPDLKKKDQKLIQKKFKCLCSERCLRISERISDDYFFKEESRIQHNKEHFEYDKYPEYDEDIVF